MEKIKKNPDSTPGRPKQELSGRQIQSVQRAVNILNCFTATNPALTLGQISSRLNLNKGTVHGILNTLRNNGYISQNMAGQYMLGAELFNKACLAPDTRKKVCVDHGHDRLQELSDEFQANGTLFSVADGRLLVLDATEPANCAFIVRRATPEISLYGSASGKIALAYLPPRSRRPSWPGLPSRPLPTAPRSLGKACWKISRPSAGRGIPLRMMSCSWAFRPLRCPSSTSTATSCSAP